MSEFSVKILLQIIIFTITTRLLVLMVPDDVVVDTPPIDLTRPSRPLHPGFIQALCGGSESRPTGKPDPDATAPACLQQQCEEEELAACGPITFTPPCSVLSLRRFKTCKSGFVLGS